MTEALKELFDAYKHLPVGVMFFKEQKLFFLNDHLKNVLLLQNLGSDDVISIIGEMVDLKEASHESLCDFFLHNNLFLYRDKHFQIDRQSYDNIDVFVIVRLSHESIKLVDQTRILRDIHSDNDTSHFKANKDEATLINKIFGNLEDGRFPSLVLYKGIPIKGECTLHHAHKGKIIIGVEKKQLCAAQIGTKWLIGSKRDNMLLSEVLQYDLIRSEVTLHNIQIVAQSFHLRQVIRYATSHDDQMIVSLDGKKHPVFLRDVSEKGTSIQTDNALLLVALSSVKGKELDAELILSNIKIMIKAVWLYTVPVYEGTQMKVAFSISYDVQNGNLLREWLNNKQLQLIREVRTFVQMLPAPHPVSNSGEWNI
ncbi:hypothetical protein [Sulfuricurvum sp.]|uniref:hypothetical protein n=1 Tax=Sulfuricurvum sp. TaxID=2025608 RepID=UPI003BB7F1E8